MIYVNRTWFTIYTYVKRRKQPTNKSLLLLKFDKLIVNYAILHGGNIGTELNEKLNKN